MTLANAQKSAHLVVPHRYFTFLSTCSDQAEMVIELHYCQIALVCTVYAPEALTCLIISLVVDEVTLFISVDNLIHFIFPNEYHVYNVALISFFLFFICEILVRNLFFLICLLVLLRCHIVLSGCLSQESSSCFFLFNILNLRLLLCYGYFLLTRCWGLTSGAGLPSLTSKLLLKQLIRMIKSSLIVLVFEYILKLDSRLYVDNLNCSIVRGLVCLSVPFVLSNNLTVDFRVSEYILVQSD